MDFAALAQSVGDHGAVAVVPQGVFALLPVDLADHAAVLIVGVLHLTGPRRVIPFRHAALTVVHVFCHAAKRVGKGDKVVTPVGIPEPFPVRQPDLRDVSRPVHSQGEPCAAWRHNGRKKAVLAPLHADGVAIAVLHPHQPAQVHAEHISLTALFLYNVLLLPAVCRECQVIIVIPAVCAVARGLEYRQRAIRRPVSDVPVSI